MKIRPTASDKKRQQERLYRQVVPTALKKGELRKLEIIRATVKCLHELGLEATNYETIGQACRMKRPHVAYHFPEKASMVEAAIRYVYSAGQEIVVERMKLAGDDLLKAYVRGTFEWVTDEPAYGSVVALLGYLSTRDEKFRELSRAFRRIGSERMQAMLNTDARTAELAHSMLLGNVAYFLTCRPATSISRFETDTLAAIKKIVNLSLRA